MRPTSGKVLLALFNILSTSGHVRDADFLDLYSGTGEVAIEAALRGARSVVAVEADRGASARITARIRECRLEAAVRCICADVRRALPRLAGGGEPAVRFDVIFADPPYCMGWGETLPRLIEENLTLLKPGGVFVFERSAREIPRDMILPRDDRIYGETVLSFYRTD